MTSSNQNTKGMFGILVGDPTESKHGEVIDILQNCIETNLSKIVGILPGHIIKRITILDGCQTRICINLSDQIKRLPRIQGDGSSTGLIIGKIGHDESRVV